MPINWTDFHFIRPEYLWLLIPILFLLYQASQYAKKESNWHKIISPHLLEYLFVRGQSQKTKSGFWLTGLVSILTILAISGPSVRQNSVPVFQTEQAQVILLDLSLSMDATDIKPSRLERAKFKLLDLLKQTNEGTIALVVYAGDAFVISPLTSDAKTVANMVPALSTSIMPVLGSRPDIAIKKSIDLLKNAKYSSGQIIWLTDGVESKYVKTIAEIINDTDFNLSILAIGTEQGAPIPLPDKSGFLKDASGKIVVPKLQADELNQIAAQSKAGIIQLTADNQDITYLVNTSQLQTDSQKAVTENEQLVNRWIDDGYWIIWPILFLFLIKLIRHPAQQGNSLLSCGLILITISSLYSSPSNAIEWQDLWLTKNQQADKAYQHGEFENAAKLYENKEWQAAAQYKNGDYSDAATNFDPSKSAQSLYNHATSLAKASQLQEALDAYNKLLEKEPEHEDALFNKKIIEDLLKEQQNQQQNEQNSDQENKDQQKQDSESDSEQQQENSEQENQQENKNQQQEQQESEESSEQKSQAQQAEVSQDERNKSEKDQALEHWLEKIPDDPGGLLRRKMYREYQRRGRQQKEEKLW
ncbi:vWA domain-containing protein [Aliikangiella sp. IMCC44359]|uniref:vWA domain-containing protein n=1 Tax=Aliikangiella sp. IMCC44359 TaxID=3459125 RepID=UPI00403B36A0